MDAHRPHPDSDGPIEILCIEDNPGDIRLIQEAFETTDHDISLHIVRSGDDAVDYLTRQTNASQAPDLALLDLNLPDWDGCDILESIRDDPQLHYLPVIMLTSSAAEEDIARCYQATANAYLTKPTDLGEYITMVEAIEDFWFKRAQLPLDRLR